VTCSERWAGLVSANERDVRRPSRHASSGGIAQVSRRSAGDAVQLRVRGDRRPVARGRLFVVWVGLAASGGLGYLTVRDVRWDRVWEALANGNYWWLIPALLPRPLGAHASGFSKVSTERNCTRGDLKRPIGAERRIRLTRRRAEYKTPPRTPSRSRRGCGRPGSRVRAQALSATRQGESSFKGREQLSPPSDRLL
jgi:hypothetical protein